MDDLDRVILSAVAAEDEALLRAARDETHVFSESYQRKMALLLHNKRPARRGSLWRRKFVAFLLAAALLVGSVTAGAFWEEISAFFQSMYGQYADLVAVRQPTPAVPLQNDVMSGWKSYWYLDYLPEDYSFSQAANRPKVKSIVFQSESGAKLYFEQMPIITVVGNDTEGTPVDGVSVGDFETFAFEKVAEGSCTRILLWSDGTTSFRLTGQLSFDELKTTAENIVYIDNGGE